MRRDVDRTEIPGGSAYNMVDFIPDEVQAVTGGRGGWTYAGAALSGATRIHAVGYHPDTGKLVAVDQARNLWDVAAATQIGTFSSVLTDLPSNPAYHRGYLIFPVKISGTPAYYKSDGTVGQLSGAPSAELVAVYKDHTLLGNITGQGQRLFFSAPGDPTTWDTTFGYWDTTGQIVGLGTVPGSILIFHTDSVERLRGTTPPPGSDMVLEPFLPNIGLLDPFSIAYYQNGVLWASANGLYRTDGSHTIDLTANAQMKTYWASLIDNYLTGDLSTRRIAGGVYRGHYIVTVESFVSATSTWVTDCLCVNLESGAMWRFSNLQAGSFVNVQFSQKEKLFVGQWNAGRVAELSSLWNPSATVKQDGDGTNPTPIVETGMFRGFDRLHRRWIESMGKQKWRWAYVDYDLRDAATDNPSATLSYCKTPAGAYTATDRTLPETTDISRVRRALSKTQGGATHSQMLGLKLAVNGPYASAKLLTLEGDFSPIDIGAL